MSCAHPLPMDFMHRFLLPLERALVVSDVSILIALMLEFSYKIVVCGDQLQVSLMRTPWNLTPTPPYRATPHNHTMPHLTWLAFSYLDFRGHPWVSHFSSFSFPALDVGATNKNVPECPNASLVFGRDMGENHPVGLSPDLHEHIEYMLGHTEERPNAQKIVFVGGTILFPQPKARTWMFLVIHGAHLTFCVDVWSDAALDMNSILVPLPLSFSLFCVAMWALSLLLLSSYVRSLSHSHVCSLVFLLPLRSVQCRTKRMQFDSLRLNVCVWFPGEGQSIRGQQR